MKYSGRRGLSIMAALMGVALANPHRDWSEPEVHVSKFSDKSKTLFREPHRELREFSIKGVKIMAYSKRDVIARLKYQKRSSKKG